MKKSLVLLGFLLAIATLSACSTPEEKAANHLANANELLAENKLDKARIEYANALQLNQNLTEAWFGLASIHQQKQEWDKAYKILSGIRDRQPRYMDARVMLSKLLLASNELDQALEDATDIVELAPDDPRSHAIMAAVLLRQGDPEAAWRTIEHALALDPDNPEAILTKATLLTSEEQYDSAVAVIDDALQKNPDQVAFHALKINIFGQSDNPGGIEQTYRDLVAIFPNNISYRHSLVLQYVRSRKFDQAEALLKQNISENPGDIGEKFKLIGFNQAYRSIEQAIALTEHYVQQDKDAFELKFRLGDLYLQNNQVNQAIALYRQIIESEELQPDGLRARNQLARIYLRGDNEPGSRTLVGEVLAHDKNNEEALLLRARFQLAEGRYDEAIVGLRTVLRDNPTSVEALTLIGLTHSYKGATSLAIESYTKALALDPSASAIANPLARLLVQTGQVSQADEILNNSFRAGNRDLESVMLLIKVKLELGDWEQAEQLARDLESSGVSEFQVQQTFGLIHMGREQQDESIVAFQRAHDLDPDAALPVVALVQAYLKDDKVDEARQFLKSVVAENPENFTSYQLLGQLSLTQGDAQAAIGYFTDAVRANPRLKAAYLSLASIYIRDLKFQEAEKVLAAGLAELPGNRDLSLNLALVVERQGEIERAIDLYEQLLQKHPELILAKNNLASLLTDHRDDPASLERAREIASDFKDSKVPHFRDTYAWASVKSGVYLQEALLILKGIVKDNESVGLFHYHLGEAYRKTGNTYDARNSLRTALSLVEPGTIVATQAEKSLKLLTE